MPGVFEAVANWERPRPVSYNITTVNGAISDFIIQIRRVLFLKLTDSSLSKGRKDLCKEIKNDFDTPNPIAEKSHGPESVEETEAVSDGRACYCSVSKNTLCSFEN